MKTKHPEILKNMTSAEMPLLQFQDILHCLPLQDTIAYTHCYLLAFFRSD